MNVLYLHCHDAGRWLGPAGAPVHTPHLAKLAAEGTVFKQAHATAPTCTPSRVSLLTGVYAHEADVLGLAHRGFALRQPTWHLAHYLREAGWETALAGIQHEFAAGDSHLPYAHVLPALGPVRDQAVGQAAAAWLRDPARRQRAFLLSCGFYWPHRPFPALPAEPTLGWPAPPAPLPDVPPVRADFAEAAKQMDKAAGEVLRALDDTGLRETTLVVFTTDHGPAFPGQKCNLREAGTGVVLLVRPPGGGSAARSCHALASHLDVFPTVCDYVGLSVPARCRGTSLRPACEGRAWPGHSELYAEVTFNAAYEPQRSIRTRTHKWIQRFDADRGPVLPNVDDSPSKDHWRAGGLPVAWPETELYDLINDPGETTNLAGRPEFADLAHDLRGRLAKWMQETDDPLRLGPVAPPPGAVVTPRHALSP